MFVPGHGAAWYGPFANPVDRALEHVNHGRASW
jgi:hypothetical protein